MKSLLLAIVFLLPGVGCATDADAPTDPDAAGSEVDTVGVAPDAAPEVGPTPSPVSACPVAGLDALFAGPEPPDPLAPFPAASACVAAEHDTIIVLGCPTRDDGTPAGCQIARADIAVALQRAGYGARFITTGGAVQNDWVEADTLADLLGARGIAAADIRREPQAEHTDENMYFSSLIMHDAGWQNAWVVSDSTGHLLYSAVCDANCCVELGRLTPVALEVERADGALVAQPVGHYVLFPFAEPFGAGECDQVLLDTKMMCLNLPDRRACAADLQL